MDTISLFLQPLILTSTGDQPTVPSPATLTPNDAGWVASSDLLIGQMAYNNVDDKWFYRSGSTGIQPFGTGSGGSTTLSGLTDTTIPVTIPDGSFLKYSTTNTTWEPSTTVNATTLEGSTKAEVEAEIQENLSQHKSINNITTAPSSVDWYAIGRWKTYDGKFKSMLVLHNVTGLNYNSIEFEGDVDSVGIGTWTMTINNSGSSEFTKARISQYLIGPDEYTYLEVYKNITNTGTFSIQAGKDIFNSEIDIDYEYEPLAFVDVSGLTSVRRSSEYTIDNAYINLNDALTVTADGRTELKTAKIGANSPDVSFHDLDIGAWDITSSKTKTVPLPSGLTYDQVYAEVYLKDDAETEMVPIELDGYKYISSTLGIVLVVNNGGYFDSSDYTSALNRGKIFLTIKN